MSEWRPAGRDKPKIDEIVLCWPRDSEHATALWDGGRWRVNCCGQTHWDIEYWMPLPPRPND